MYSLYDEFKNERISLAYFGVFTDEVTETIVGLCEGYLAKTEYLSEISRKTSFLITESFQNLIRHGIIEKTDVSELHYNRDFFQISILDDRVVIASVNVLYSKDIPVLEEKISKINSLDRVELKKLRNEVLKTGRFSEKGGAGLGLIEMVKKSGLPLLYKFFPLTQGFSLLILSIEMPTAEGLKSHVMKLEEIEKKYKSLVESDVLMMYKGDFSSNSNLNLIEMLENNFIKDGDIESDKVKNIVAIIEVMQNVSKHGKTIEGYKEGIFSLKIINKDLYIECSNFIKKEDYLKLKKNLKHIKSSSMQEIDQIYKEKLRDSYLTKEGDGGLGLYEIARFTNNSFAYHFIETDSDEIFYSIKIKTV